MATPMSWGTYGPMLLSSQFFTRIPYPVSSFAGETIIITGSNTGLGLEAARHVVSLGASKVILAVRTVSKGEAAAADIMKSTKATKTNIEVWPLDLSNYDSIKNFGKRVEGLERLDAVSQNAGILTQKFSRIGTEESTIRVNVIGAVLLGLLLLPKMRETAKKFNTRTRLSFVGSDMYYVAQLKEANTSGSLFEALADEKIADMDDRYGNSKLLLFYAIREIASKSPLTSDSNVVINFMTPGACKSDLFRDDDPWYIVLLRSIAMVVFARTTEVGGRTLVDAIRPDLEDRTHGAFLMDAKVAPNGPSIESEKGEQLATRFNAELFRKLEEIMPGVTAILE